MARRIYGVSQAGRNPLYDNLRLGVGGTAGGRFVTDDGTTPVAVHGWLVQLDGNLILPLGGEAIDGARIYTLP